jgi:hypothetical protein
VAIESKAAARSTLNRWIAGEIVAEGRHDEHYALVCASLELLRTDAAYCLPKLLENPWSFEHAIVFCVGVSAFPELCARLRVESESYNVHAISKVIVLMSREYPSHTSVGLDAIVAHARADLAKGIADIDIYHILADFGPSALPTLVELFKVADHGLRFQIGLTLEKFGNAAASQLKVGFFAPKDLKQDCAEVVERIRRKPQQ